MGSWWQNQLAFAEGFIEKMSDSVDKRVQSAAQPNDREVQETRQARPGHAEPGKHQVCNSQSRLLDQANIFCEIHVIVTSTLGIMT